MNDKPVNGLRISAVTIVKNEEQNIGRWLQSVKHYADEIIVVDTGSTDNTVALAEAAEARVSHFPWINDFAAAKNFALEQTTGQWIAFFDADEYYSDEDAKKVRPLLERINPRLRTVGVMQKLLNIDRDHHDRLISVTYQLRLFRRLPDVKYRGKVHEGLVGLKEKNRNLFMDEELRILHTGYSSSLNRQKTARNLEILQAEIPRRGHRPGDDYYLSDCYYGLGDYEKTIEYAKKHIASGDMIAGDETSPTKISSPPAICWSSPPRPFWRKPGKPSAGFLIPPSFTFWWGSAIFGKRIILPRRNGSTKAFRSTLTVKRD